MAQRISGAARCPFPTRTLVGALGVVAAMMAHQRKVRELGPTLLTALLAAGVGLVGVGVVVRQPLLFASGAGLVLLALIVRRLLSHGPLL